MEFKRKCPRCNETLEPEDEVCPYCGYDNLPKYEKEVTDAISEQPENPENFEMDDYDDEEKIQKEIDKNYSERANEIGALVRKVRKGDQDALAELVHMTEGRLLYVADSKLHDKMESENVVQEAFEHNIKVLDQLQEDRKFESWMTVSVRNRAINYLVKKQRRQTNTFADYDAANLDAAARSGDKDVPTFESTVENTNTSFNPEEVSRNKEIAEGLSSLLDEMPEQRKMILVYRFLQGLSVKETAEALQIPEGTVKSNTSHGMKFIEQKIIELRKQGKSFYSLAPIPFLAWLVDQEIKKANFKPIVVQAATIPPHIPTEAVTSKATVASIGKNTVATGSKLSSILGTTAAKAVIGAVAAAVIGTSVGYMAVAKVSQPAEQKEKTAETTQAKKEKETKVEEKKNDISVFGSVLQKYEKYGTETGTDDSSANWDMDTKESGLLSYLEVKKSASELGYAYEDLDEDGQDELVVGFLRDNLIYDIYTNKNGKAELLKYPLNGENADKETSTNSLYMNNTAHYWLGNGMIYTISVGSDAYSSVYKLKNEKLALVQRTKIGVHDDGTNTYYKFNLKTNKFEEISIGESKKLAKKYNLDNMKTIELTPFGKKEEASKKKQNKKTDTKTQETPQAEDNTSKTDSTSVDNNTIQGNNTYVMTGFNNQTISFGKYFVEDYKEYIESAPYLQTVAGREVQSAIRTRYKYTGCGSGNWNYNVSVTEIRYSTDAPIPPTMSQDKQDRYDISLSDGADTREYKGTEDKYCIVESIHSWLSGRLSDFDIRYVDVNHPEVEYKIFVSGWSYGEKEGQTTEEDDEALGQFTEQIYNELSPSFFAYVQ